MVVPLHLHTLCHTSPLFPALPSSRHLSITPSRFVLSPRCLAPDASSSTPTSESRLWASFMQANSHTPHSEAPSRSPPPQSATRLPHLQKYRFHAQPSCKVQVAVRKAGGDEFVVEIGVDTGGMFSECQEPLKLHWGLFRSDSTEWVLLEPDEAPDGTVVMDGV